MRPKINNERFIPSRTIRAPPPRVPVMVAARPNTFVTAPMSVFVNPRVSMKGVMSEVAITVPMLYRIMKAKILIAPSRSKKFTKGNITESFKVLGAAKVVFGRGESKVVNMLTPTSPAMIK